MFGLSFVKFQPTVYVMRFSMGKVIQEGTGLSFFYYSPTTSLVAIPLGSIETPFIFEEVTSDYQSITIQGQITYRVKDPAKISKLLNFTLNNNGSTYVSEDPKKLSQRIVNYVQVLTRRQILDFSLGETLKSGELIVENIMSGLKNNNDIASLGLDILSLSILAIKPNKDTARALEAKAREQILKEADDAIYLRRNASVEQERIIKENELNTEIAIENKKKQIREAQMESEKLVQEKQHGLQATEMMFSIKQEQEKKKLVELSAQNSKSEADANAYSLSASMKAFQGVDPTVIQALANMGMKPNQLIAIRVQVVDRVFLPNFIFGKEDIIVSIGQDGLVANTLKYLNGQPLIGINPSPNRWDGVLLPFKVEDLSKVMPEVVKNKRPYKEVSMALAKMNGGQSLLAVNDFFIGQKSHVSARYQIKYDNKKESHSSSGIIVSTGLGSTGWMKSVIAGSVSIVNTLSEAEIDLNENGKMEWSSNYLRFSVREPFPSKNTGTKLIFGKVSNDKPLVVESSMAENGIIFSDGIESDFLDFNSGASVTICLSDKKGYLVV